METIEELLNRKIKSVLDELVHTRKEWEKVVANENSKISKLEGKLEALKDLQELHWNKYFQAELDQE